MYMQRLQEEEMLFNLRLSTGINQILDYRNKLLYNTDIIQNGRLPKLMMTCRPNGEAERECSNARRIQQTTQFLGSFIRMMMKI
jgi:hypothetical protein